MILTAYIFAFRGNHKRQFNYGRLKPEKWPDDLRGVQTLKPDKKNKNKGSVEIYSS